MEFVISGNYVDIINRTIYPASLTIHDGKIQKINKQKVADSCYICPGFIDSHIHIESSMLIPSSFAAQALTHGTIATVSDPHEIANVMGSSGIRYMIRNGKKVPFYFFFGAPSSVPATCYETSGATLDAKKIKQLMKSKDIYYLSEVMNYPGVINQDQAILKKIQAAKFYGKPIDGHAPNVTGRNLDRYAEQGISTDHECFRLEEALEKIQKGMKILIREGSAAKNFEALYPLIDLYPDQVMLCSDDLHPDSLKKGHINLLCKEALKKSLNFFNILKAACINPITHYKLPLGKLQVGDSADFIVLKDVVNFEVTQTYIKGRLVAKENKSLFKEVKEKSINQFVATSIKKSSIVISEKHNLVKNGLMPIIEPFCGQLITSTKFVEPKICDAKIVADPKNDILKIVVYNRYKKSRPQIAFIKNFGFKTGAIASSVCHDSHNIIAVGVEDESIVKAINLVIKHKGGISAVKGNKIKILPLEVAGLMSLKNSDEVAQQYEEVNSFAKSFGNGLKEPFMTLSFMSLLVIPEIKLSDLGLFNVSKQTFIE